MSRVAVQPTLFQWARERSGKSAESLLVKFPKLGDWERGAAKPTLRQLEDFARTTMTPFGYFFLSRPPEEKLPVPDFRTVSDLPVRSPSPNLLEMVQSMQRRQDWMREFLLDQGQEPLDFVGSASLRADPIHLAQSIRDELGFRHGWAAEVASWTRALRVLRDAIEGSGILVVVNGIVGNNTHRKLDPREFRGFVLVDDRAPLMFVNGSDGKAAQMFTLAHELAHLWIGQAGVFNLPDLLPANFEAERFCNRVAAEFLIPQAELLDLWLSLQNRPEPFRQIAAHFKVSTVVAARRALDLDLISRDEFFAFYEEYEQDERRKAKPSDGGDFYATQQSRIGRRFGVALVLAVREGRMLYRDAYELSGLYGKTFDRYAEGLEI